MKINYLDNYSLLTIHYRQLAELCEFLFYCLDLLNQSLVISFIAFIHL